VATSEEVAEDGDVEAVVDELASECWTKETPGLAWAGEEGVLPNSEGWPEVAWPVA
jgi:hypothetical protein